MAFALIWLPQVLKDAGLKVALVEGWETRGRGDAGPTQGVLCHHTAGPRNGNMPSLETLIHGRSDLRGPLAQLGLGRDGTYYVIAAGRCNHAGAGSWQGIANGNTNFIGIEAENTGRDDDMWPDVQIDAYQRGVAAILKHVQLPAIRCAGHKEYAPGRKPDPSFDMIAFRNNVAAIMAGTAAPPVLIPRIESAPHAGGAQRETLRRGSTGPLVTQLQRKIGLRADDHFGAHTEAAVRDFQRARGLVPDGIVGPKTWAALDATPPSAASITLPPTPSGTTHIPPGPWPNTVASKMVAAFIHLKHGVSPGDLLLLNPPMSAMPFFNNAASEDMRRAELALVAESMLRLLGELAIPFEPGSTLGQAHTDLVAAMMSPLAPSSNMSLAINNHYRFLDEVDA